jgi:predicted 3-demethylubiquinone-9 3-methyltransferase (glyoxalase superfamily)
VDGDAAVTGKITPFLWFDGKAEEAANFYVSVFENARILGVSRYAENSPGPAGTVMTVEFELEGQKFIALNGGPYFTFTPAISFSIDCRTQEEVDTFWERLSEGGQPGQCGWLQDKYGVSWQVVPSVLPELLRGDDDDKSDAALQAMLKMAKLDIETLRAAYDRS